jgi:tetratricopeptide (TPR) repeat protein
LETLSRLLDDLDTTGDPTNITTRRAEIAARRADCTLETGHLSDAAQVAEKAVSLAMHTNTFDIAARAYATWSSALYRQGKFETASAIAGEGYRIAQKNGDKHGQGLTLNLLGLIALEQKDSATVRRYLEESLIVAQETHNRRQQARSLNNLGNLAGATSDFISARDRYLQALQITREIGDRAGEGLVLGNLGWVNGSLGDYASARSYSEQNLRIAHEVGEPTVEAYVLINLSSYAGRHGDHTAATTFAEQSLSMARHTGDPSCQAWALTYLGHALQATNHYDPAQDAYQAALEIRRSLGQPHLACEPLAGLAQLALAQGDLSAAQNYAGTVLDHLQGGGTLEGTDEPLRVYLACYRILEAIRDPTSTRVLEAAYNLLQERAAMISDPDMRRNFLENVPYHREILEAKQA